MSTLKKNIVFIGVYLLGCGAYLWFDPIMKEQWSELADVLMTVVGVVGLVWANARAFPDIAKPWRRLAARAGAVAALSVALHSVVFCYSWQIRPALSSQSQARQSENNTSDGIRQPSPVRPSP